MNRIGKYELVRVIGHGATATVYLGRDPFAQRDVAIKVASPDILKNAERGKLYFAYSNDGAPCSSGRILLEASDE